MAQPCRRRTLCSSPRPSRKCGVVTTINNINTQKLEQSRAQSTIILEAIKTSGDTNAVCKNLVFLVSLGLIEDTNRAITGACPGNVQGVPSVSVGPPDKLGGTLFYPLMVHAVDGNGVPMSDVSVEGDLVPSNTPSFHQSSQPLFPLRATFVGLPVAA